MKKINVKLGAKVFEEQFTDNVAVLPMDAYTMDEFEDCIASIKRLCKQNKYRFYEIESQDDIDSLDFRFVDKESVEIQIGDIVCLGNSNILYATEYFESELEKLCKSKDYNLNHMLNFTYFKIMLNSCNYIKAL